VELIGDGVRGRVRPNTAIEEVKITSGLYAVGRSCGLLSRQAERVPSRLNVIAPFLQIELGPSPENHAGEVGRSRPVARTPAAFIANGGIGRGRRGPHLHRGFREGRRARVGARRISIKVSFLDRLGRSVARFDDQLFVSAWRPIHGQGRAGDENVHCVLPARLYPPSLSSCLPSLSKFFPARASGSNMALRAGPFAVEDREPGGCRGAAALDDSCLLAEQPPHR